MFAYAECVYMIRTRYDHFITRYDSFITRLYIDVANVLHLSTGDTVQR